MSSPTIDGLEANARDPGAAPGGGHRGRGASAKPFRARGGASLSGEDKERGARGSGALGGRAPGGLSQNHRTQVDGAAADPVAQA